MPDIVICSILRAFMYIVSVILPDILSVVLSPTLNLQFIAMMKKNGTHRLNDLASSPGR